VRNLRTLLFLFIAASMAGCVGPSEEELREAAGSLVPSGSTIVKEVAADCVELARSPSCVHIYFVLAGREEERASAVRRAARASGWAVEAEDSLRGGTSFQLGRGELRAAVYLASDDEAVRCTQNPSRSCADVVMVEAG
jgi:hypothetical protein